MVSPAEHIAWAGVLREGHMGEFFQLKNQINVLSRAEYAYDRLTSQFVEHYLSITQASYKTIPDLEVLHTWLKHLNFEIRPALVEHWRAVANLAGFELGELVEVDGTKLYAVKASAYPDLDYISFTGFNAKKDGSPGRSSVHASLWENSRVTRFDKRMDEATLTPYFFEGSSRLPQVKDFLQAELAKLT
ncbi:hypothetical protein [Aliidiomarina soli]|uniref:Uncharacterized protein n=1 Tax=Aliidiomarina soli TaxID=1928574 RepID=A0A432WM54_9GAMM|nr:hypothetical protein [Aliidiomarina soli]RUO34811.1 hypothetical protein CWE14_02090 [Aliidiomarina soli]